MGACACLLYSHLLRHHVVDALDDDGGFARASTRDDEQWFAHVGKYSTLLLLVEVGRWAVGIVAVYHQTYIKMAGCAIV